MEKNDYIRAVETITLSQTAKQQIIQSCHKKQCQKRGVKLSYKIAISLTAICVVLTATVILKQFSGISITAGDSSQTAFYEIKDSTKVKTELSWIAEMNSIPGVPIMFSYGTNATINVYSDCPNVFSTSDNSVLLDKSYSQSAYSGVQIGGNDTAYWSGEFLSDEVRYVYFSVSENNKFTDYGVIQIYINKASEQEFYRAKTIQAIHFSGDTSTVSDEYINSKIRELISTDTKTQQETNMLAEYDFEISNVKQEYSLYKFFITKPVTDENGKTTWDCGFRNYNNLEEYQTVFKTLSACPPTNLKDHLKVLTVSNYNDVKYTLFVTDIYKCNNDKYLDLSLIYGDRMINLNGIIPIEDFSSLTADRYNLVVKNENGKQSIYEIDFTNYNITVQE